MKTLPFFLITVSSFLSWSLASEAGTVSKRAGSKILMDFPGENIPSVNDKVFILDQDNQKEVGIVLIQKVKDSRALGKLIEGTAKAGDITDIAGNESNDRVPADEESVQESKSRGQSSQNSNRSKKSAFGVGLNYINTSIAITNSIGTGTAAGSSFGLRGYWDYAFSRHWTLLTSLGTHGLSASLTDPDFSMTQEINMVALDGTFRYMIDQRNKGLWLGGGLGYYIPGDSNYKSKLGFHGMAGYNIRMGKNHLSLHGEALMFTPEDYGSSKMQTYQFMFGGAIFF